MSNENFTDYDVQCVDCGASFTFPAGDQEFYKERGFSEPKRCPSCRQTRKNSRNNNRSNYSSRY